MTPIRAFIFDFHATLVDQGDADEWLDRAVARAGAGVAMDDMDREAVTRRLDEIWSHAREIDPGSGRDLSAQNHRDVFHGVMDGHVDDGLRHALYDVMLDTWKAYDDTLPTLRLLREQGIRICLLSNAGVPIRTVLDRDGLTPYYDAIVLSYEVGFVKPDLRIFQASLEALGLPASDVLMVGDNANDDGGGTHLGLRTLILPRTQGRIHGLHAVTALVAGVNAAATD